MIKTTTKFNYFNQEVELISQNEELMEFLKQRSQDTKRATLVQVKK